MRGTTDSEDKRRVLRDVVIPCWVGPRRRKEAAVHAPFAEAKSFIGNRQTPLFGMSLPDAVEPVRDAVVGAAGDLSADASVGVGSAAMSANGPSLSVSEDGTNGVTASVQATAPDALPAQPLPAIPADATLDIEKTQIPAIGAEATAATNGVAVGVPVQEPVLVQQAANGVSATYTNGNSSAPPVNGVNGKAEVVNGAAAVKSAPVPPYYNLPSTAYAAERTATDRKSYQARALGRRTLSYQSRLVSHM